MKNQLNAWEQCIEELNALIRKLDEGENHLEANGVQIAIQIVKKHKPKKDKQAP